MGKVPIFTPEQTIILDEVKKHDFLKKQFYFTGGTALNSFYLQHRYSEDLDFFSESEFDNQIIFTLMSDWSKKHQFTFESRFNEVVYVFNLVFRNSTYLKVDFAYYPYKRIEKEKVIDDMQVDSLTDIAVNKLLTITQRKDVKDFVDLFFLLKKFTIWDLREGVRIKFRMELDSFILGYHFLKIDDFTNLPRMIKPLTLDTLRDFFRKKAKELGEKAVE